MCKCNGLKCNVAPVLKILGLPRLPPGGSLGTGKRGTLPKIGVPCRFFSMCKWGLNVDTTSQALPVTQCFVFLTGCKYDSEEAL